MDHIAISFAHSNGACIRGWGELAQWVSETVVDKLEKPLGERWHRLAPRNEGIATRDGGGRERFLSAGVQAVCLFELGGPAVAPAFNSGSTWAGSQALLRARGEVTAEEQRQSSCSGTASTYPLGGDLWACELMGLRMLDHSEGLEV